MSHRRLSEAELARRLDACRADYAALKNQIDAIGFICEGSLNEVYTSCRNPNCRCADPDQRHGPYWQLTWKHDGKTVTRRLNTDQVALYREWTANRDKLADLVYQMRRVSHRAGGYWSAPRIPDSGSQLDSLKGTGEYGNEAYEVQCRVQG